MEKKKLSTRWKVLIAVGCVLLALILAGGGFAIWMTSGLSKYSKMSIADVDLTNLKDGTYTGSFNGGRFSNTVSVTVKDHKITAVDVVKDVRFKAPDKVGLLFDRVIEEQTPNVDTIAGATVTSKAFLKSVENALKAQQ